MGIWSWLFGEEAPPQPAVPKYDVWRDPAPTAPTELWERKLQAYGKKAASQLTSAGVEEWRSKPRGAEGCFNGGFWLISVDVDKADKRLTDLYVAHDHRTGKPYLRTNTNDRHWEGSLRGDALLLSSSGMLCTSRFEAWVNRDTGGMGNNNEDILFRQITYDKSLLQRSPWGWGNTGRWRYKPHMPPSADYLQPIMEANFKGRLPGFSDPRRAPGQGSSASISAFVKSGGKPQWPRYFNE